MDTNRGFIIGMALFAALTATSTVAAAEASSSVEGTLYAAAPRVQHPALDPDTAKRQPRSSSNVVPVRDLRADRAVSGSEPDPETFDKVGLESWWTKHRKAAK